MKKSDFLWLLGQNLSNLKVKSFLTHSQSTVNLLCACTAVVVSRKDVSATFA